jgi:hypothetical protein
MITALPAKHLLRKAIQSRLTAVSKMLPINSSARAHSRTSRISLNKLPHRPTKDLLDKDPQLLSLHQQRITIFRVPQ